MRLKLLDFWNHSRDVLIRVAINTGLVSSTVLILDDTFRLVGIICLVTMFVIDIVYAVAFANIFNMQHQLIEKLVRQVRRD